MNVAKVQGGLLKAVLTPSSAAPKVSRAAPFSTPWRTLLIAPDAPSALHGELADPQPQRAQQARRRVVGQAAANIVGIWWNMITRQLELGAGQARRDHRQRQKIHRLRRRQRIRGVLVEGWNVGWDGDWFGNGNGHSASPSPTPISTCRSSPPTPSRRAWTSSAITRPADRRAITKTQLDARVRALRRQHGIDAVKTGYVTDAGGRSSAIGAGRQASVRMARGPVDGAPPSAASCRQPRSTTSRSTATSRSRTPGCAAPIPTGSRARARAGMEYNAWGGKNPPEHESEPGLHADAGRADGFHPRRAEPEGARRQRHPVDHRQAARALRRALFAGRDGGRHARKLREISRARSSSSRTCRPTGPTRAC